MDIKVKLPDTFVPSKPGSSPFEYDKLNREEFANLLTNIVKNIESPCVIAVDSAWGTGKTTFINMWTQQLRNNGFPVAAFNAWQNDFAENAMVALTSELTKLLKTYNENFADTRKSDALEALKRTMVKSGTNVAKLATLGVLELDTDPITEESNLLKNYISPSDLINNFRNSLEALALELRQRSKCPVVIVIDEMDRCRPLYSINLLEAAKHIFSVANVIFVVAINRNELGHSIKAVYGDQFDSQEYLKRFIDVDFHLPDADRKNFIVSIMNAETRALLGNSRYKEPAHELIFKVFGAPETSLRIVAHYIRRLEMIMASVGSNPIGALIFATVFALLARAVDSRSYILFYRGEVTDEEFFDSLFNNARMRNLRNTNESSNIESLLICAYLYKIQNLDYLEDFNSSPLYRKYQNVRGDSLASEQEVGYAASVVKLAESSSEHSISSGIPNPGRLYFEAVSRIELLSPRLAET